MLTCNQDLSIGKNRHPLRRPQGEGRPRAPALEAQVLRHVTEAYPSHARLSVAVQDPVYRRLDITARVFFRQGATPSVVRDAIRANLQAWFRVSEPDGTPNPNVDFGFNIKDVDGNPVVRRRGATSSTSFATRRAFARWATRGST